MIKPSPGATYLSDEIQEPRQGRSREKLCNYCDGATQETKLLDTRNGKDVRLLRCTKCGRLSWADQR